MSRQLAISATASIVATALFALTVAMGNAPFGAHSATGATASAAAPALDRMASVLVSLR